MDKSFTPLTVSLPVEGRDVEFWSYGKVRVGYRKDGRYWVGGISVLVDGWRPIKKAEKPQAIPTETAAVADSVPARRGRPRKPA